MDKIRTTPKITGERIKEYMKKENKRFDGRKLDEFRELSIEKNISEKAEGSVRVKLGKTEVVVGIKLGVDTPYADTPTKGNFMVTAEMLPLSSSRFESGPPKFDAIEWARVTDRGLRESGFIDFEKLCIKEGEKVWTVFVDVYSINDDGNLMDAATIGAIAALKLAKIPKYNEETGKINYDESSGKGLPLTEVVPVAISVHKIGDSLVIDPTKEEEDLSGTRVTLGSSKGMISSLQKSKGEELQIDEIKRIFEIATKISEDIRQKIEKAIK